MAPTTKRGRTSNQSQQSHQDELSRIAKSWWKLKLSDQTAHNEAMKIQLLSPFLYRKLYQSDVWIEWAKSASLLSGNRLTELMNELSIDEIKNTDLMEMVMINFQDQIKLEFNNKSIKHNTFDGVIRNMHALEREKSVLIVISKLKDQSWFKNIKSGIMETFIGQDKTQDKYDAAIVLVAWQISHYVRAIFNGNNLLKDFQANCELDVEAEKNKAKGNEFFKNEQFERAINAYTNILCNKPYLYIVYGNRALCFLKIGQYWSALADGRRCTTLNPKWIKGQKRFAEALVELGYRDAALCVLEKAKDICESSDFLVSYMKEIKDKMDTDKRKGKSTANGDYESDIGDSSFSEDNFDDDDDYLSDMNDSGEDIPELVSDSEDSDSNDEFDGFGTKKVSNKANENKPKRVPPYMVGSFMGKGGAEILAKKTAEEAEEKEKLNLLRKKENLKRECLKAAAKGSSAITRQGHFQSIDPIKEYKNALDVVTKADVTFLTAKEMVVLLYAHAYSYLECETLINVKRSVEMFTEITVKYKEVMFPLPFYGIAKAHLKQMNFHLIRSFCDRATEMNGRNGHLAKVCWPGLTVQIEESLPGKLKVALKDLVAFADNPPQPDAVCFYGGCLFEKDKIYFAELEHKGFVRAQCDKKHFLEYHTQCWNKVSKFDDGPKKMCLKNQCGGNVMAIERYTRVDKSPIIEYIGDTDSPKTKKKKKKGGGNSNTNTTNNNNDENTKNEENKENTGPSAKKKKKKKKSKEESPDLSRRNERFEKYTANIIPDFDFESYGSVIENPKIKTFEIYNYIEGLLTDREEPFIHLDNNKQLIGYQNNFSGDLKSFINVVGGLRALLTKCKVFSFDTNQRNIVYLTCMEKEFKDYRKRKEKLLTTQTPKCQDSLFTDESLIKNKKTKNESNEKKSVRQNIEEINGEVSDDNDVTTGQKCVVYTGVQVDTYADERKQYEKAEKDIQDFKELNAKLVTQLKNEREEKEKIFQSQKLNSDELQKLKKQTHQETMECRKGIEKLMREKKSLEKEHRDEIKKLQRELQDIREASEKSSEKYSKQIETFSSTATSIQQEYKTKMQRDQQEHEEIVQGLTTSIMDETKRAQKAEVALLEARRDLVVIKYQQQANFIQNTINRLYVLPQTAEFLRIRKTWEEYKLEYQSSFEKMQEEFTVLIQLVNQGQRLDSLPPAKYSHPPPYPQEAMPTGSNPSQAHPVPPPGMMPQPNQPPPQQQRPMAPPPGNTTAQPNPMTQTSHPNAPSHKVPVITAPNKEARQAPIAPPKKGATPVDEEIRAPSDQKLPEKKLYSSGHDWQAQASATAYSTAPPHSDSEDSESSNRSGESAEDHKINKFTEKIMMKLGSKFPSAPRDELLYFFNEYRKQGPLSGQKIDDIVINVERLMKRQKAAMRAESVKHQNRAGTPEKKKAPRVQGSGALNHGAASKRSRANQVPPKASSSGKSSIFGSEEPCVICYEDMYPQNRQPLQCGHTFHKDCIQCWLKEQRTCPVCRVFALLPDEFPALG
ncbi:uncharacterized protein [Clytia hemisphaerica]